MEKILLTGVAGFIASQTAELLLEKGYYVVGLDNMNDYYDVRMKEYRVDRLKRFDNFEFHAVDIENYSDLERFFEEHRFSAVLNLAARAGVRYSMENPTVYMNTNAMGTLNLLELMQKNDVKKMVLASTSSLYAGQKMPFKEDLPVNTPISPYAASKKSAEVMCHAHHYLYDLDISIVRYFTVYGPAGRPDMCIFRFIKWIDEGTPITLYGDGTQSRDFTYVRDIAEGTIAAMRPVGYEIFNLGGGGDPISLLEVIEKIEKALGKKAKIEKKAFHKADMVKTSADITKAGEILGWKPQISFEDGLQATIDWYLENKELASRVNV